MLLDKILFREATSGVAGVVWAIIWFAITFEKPASHPSISKEEKEFIEESLGHVSHVIPSVTRNISVHFSEIQQFNF